MAVGAQDAAVAILIVAAFALAAFVYRNIPQFLGWLSLKRAESFPTYRAARAVKAREEFTSYKSALADASAFQAEALHRLAMIVLSGVMTLLGVGLFVASQLMQLRWPAAHPAAWATVDALLVLFALTSLVGLRLAVFRLWIFLHPNRNMRRLERTLARLETHRG